MNQNFDIIIVGGGAAGFFTAINIVEKNPKLKVAILERGKEVLSEGSRFWWWTMQCNSCLL
jgi:succinate dehydrogenase/fumarate reductase flavoprotein subunit